MSIVFLSNISFVIIVSVFTFWLGIHIYSSDKKARANFYFLWLSILLALWLVFGFLAAMLFTDPFLCTISAKINYAVVSLFFIPWYFFFVFFPKEIKRPAILDKIVTLGWVLFALVSLFTDFFIKGTEVGKFGEWGSSVLYGPGLEFFHLATGGFAVLTLLILIKNYFKLSRENKLKTSYLIIGLFLFVLGNLVFNIAFPAIRGDSQYYQLGDYSVVFIIIFTAIAITKKGLFKARIIATTFFILFIFVLLLFDFIFSYQQPSLQIFKGIILLFFIVFAYLLVRGTKIEIKQKERLSKLNEELENKVRERTKELSDRVVELEKFHRLTVGREIRMVELKKKIKKLKKGS